LSVYPFAAIQLIQHNDENQQQCLNAHDAPELVISLGIGAYWSLKAARHYYSDKKFSVRRKNSTEVSHLTAASVSCDGWGLIATRIEQHGDTRSVG
jgi:hypothetical protein